MKSFLSYYIFIYLFIKFHRDQKLNIFFEILLLRKKFNWNLKEEDEEVNTNFCLLNFSFLSKNSFYSLYKNIIIYFVVLLFSFLIFILVQF